MRAQIWFGAEGAAIASAGSPIGHLAVAAAKRRVAGVTMAHATAPQAANRLARMLGQSLSAGQRRDAGDADELLAVDVLERLVRFLEGEAVTLKDIPLALDHLSAFQRKVVAACRAIPYGETRTYGELAAKAGSQGAARAVGTVMAGNRMPLIVPCHRVVAAGGKIGGFSAPSGLSLKRRLLALESAFADDPPLFAETERSVLKSRLAKSARR
jgi:methylated-DNA-[protein]-cysteine S-methyltransferase